MDNKISNLTLWILGILSGLYGAINQIIPAISGGNIASIIFLIIGGIIITTVLFGIAKNPKIEKKSVLKDQIIISNKYSKLVVLASRIGIVFLLIGIAFGTTYNLKKMQDRSIAKNKEGIHFITEEVKVNGNKLRIDFNVTNNTKDKILITSFETLEYHKENTCRHQRRPPDRNGLELTEGKSPLGKSYIIDPNDLLTFSAFIDYKVYSCIFKVFGLKFNFNKINGDLLFEMSDAIYFIDVGTGIARFDFFRPDRFTLLLNSKDPKSFTYGYVEPYPDKYFGLAKSLYEIHKTKYQGL